jgi:hypothetical protein
MRSGFLPLLGTLPAGLVAGVYFCYYISGHLGGTTWILAILTWIGSGGIVVTFFLNRLSLEFGEIITYDEEKYFIDVKKKGGKNKAEDCEGWIKVGDIDTAFVWALGEPRVISIADHMV